MLFSFFSINEWEFMQFFNWYCQIVFIFPPSSHSISYYMILISHVMNDNDHFSFGCLPFISSSVNNSWKSSVILKYYYWTLRVFICTEYKYFIWQKFWKSFFFLSFPLFIIFNSYFRKVEVSILKSSLEIF